MHTDSPLRYPGGKARLTNFISLVLKHNRLCGSEYVEPFTGGGGVALALLFGYHVDRIHLNDIDPAVHAFWHSCLRHTDLMCEMVAHAPLTVEHWLKQRDIYRTERTDLLALGFACFYLNRTNRSGIIGNGGVIGGLRQDGNWKMDARFNRAELVDRIARIGRRRDDIALTNLDAIELLRRLRRRKYPKCFAYLDPPYYVKGQQLYANAYAAQDHARLASNVVKLPFPWVVSYDDHEDLRTLYKNKQALSYELGYSARERYNGREVLFVSDTLELPTTIAPTEISAAMVLAHRRYASSCPRVAPGRPMGSALEAQA